MIRFVQFMKTLTIFLYLLLLLMIIQYILSSISLSLFIKLLSFLSHYYLRDWPEWKTIEQSVTVIRTPKHQGISESRNFGVKYLKEKVYFLSTFHLFYFIFYFSLLKWFSFLMLEQLLVTIGSYPL